MTIKFGPAGIGPVVRVEETFADYKKEGIKAAEIPFTYGVYIKKKEVAEKVKKAAEKNGIGLSVHAPYWINLNSAEEEKIVKSKERILNCCEVGSWLGASKVVFHPGYYGKDSKEKTYAEIKKAILEMLDEVKKNKWDIELAPETSGKVNVFGSVEEIHKLVEETGCGFCLDFAHILARYKSYNFEEVLGKFKDKKKLHIHFSGIEYGNNGEKRHIETDVKYWEKLLDGLKDAAKKKDLVIINESKDTFGDSVKGIKVWKGMNK